MKRKHLFVTFLAVILLAACGEEAQKSTDTAPVQPQAAAPSAGGNQAIAAPTAPATPQPSVGTGQPLAKINGETITDDDVRKVAGPKLQQAEMDLYDARKDAIDQIIDDKLLEAEAKKQGTTKADLLKKDVYDKIKIEDKDIEKFYEDNKAQMQGKKLEDVKQNIRGYLFREKHQKVYGDLMDELRKKADVEFLIHAPKVAIEEGDNPAIGPKNAPVKIVEFTDYQCPFCGKSRPTVTQILDEYKGRVRYVLRDFPLSFHKDSEKAHEGARCAGEQNKYWDMNKKLFSNQQAIKVDDVKKYAQDLKLNLDKFNQCLDSGKYAEVIKQNQEYGEKVGVSGTPAFFINGRMISGARPYASFKEIIDDEIRDAKNKK